MSGFFLSKVGLWDLSTLLCVVLVCSISLMYIVFHFMNIPQFIFQHSEWKFQVPTLTIVTFFILAILLYVWWSLLVVFICVSLATKDGDHVFIYLLAIYISSFVKCLFKCFFPFFGLFCPLELFCQFFSCWFVVLYIFCIYFAFKSFVRYISCDHLLPLSACLCTSLLVSFCEKILNFKVVLFISLFLHNLCFCILSKRSLLTLRSWRHSPGLS